MRKRNIDRRSFLKNILFAGGGVLIGSTIYACGSAKLEISREKFVIPGIERNLRIVAVSDVHAPCLYSMAIDLVHIVNKELPDIFVLAGDIVDRRGNEPFVGLFDKVKAPFSKIATLGNWEYLGGLDLATLRQEYDKAGISLLANSSLVIAGLTILGLDDLSCGSPDYLTLRRTPNKLSPLLVVSHCPASFDQLTALPHSRMLVLSGHTHGGQITPFGLTIVTPPGSGTYVKGWYSKGNHSMYVMRGIGTTPGIPLRIGARPELLVLDLIGT